jgi:hypothetical protein
MMKMETRKTVMMAETYSPGLHRAAGNTDLFEIDVGEQRTPPRIVPMQRA